MKKHTVQLKSTCFSKQRGQPPPNKNQKKNKHPLEEWSFQPSGYFFCLRLVPFAELKFIFQSLELPKLGEFEKVSETILLTDLTVFFLIMQFGMPLKEDSYIYYCRYMIWLTFHVGFLFF